MPLPEFVVIADRMLELATTLARVTVAVHRDGLVGADDDTMLKIRNAAQSISDSAASLQKLLDEKG